MRKPDYQIRLNVKESMQREEIPIPHLTIEETS